MRALDRTDLERAAFGLLMFAMVFSTLAFGGGHCYAYTISFLSVYRSHGADNMLDIVTAMQLSDKVINL